MTFLEKWVKYRVQINNSSPIFNVMISTDQLTNDLLMLIKKIITCLFCINRNDWRFIITLVTMTQPHQYRTNCTKLTVYDRIDL